MVHDPDLVAFGTDKDERWVGYDALMAAVKAQFAAFRTTGIAVSHQVVHVTPAGDGAYFSAVWDWSMRSKGEHIELKNLRVTGVLVRRDERWRIAQFHMSMPLERKAVEY